LLVVEIQTSAGAKPPGRSFLLGLSGGSFADRGLPPEKVDFSRITH
jgi:hypothetical protein